MLLLWWWQMLSYMHTYMHKTFEWLGLLLLLLIEGVSGEGECNRLWWWLVSDPGVFCSIMPASLSVLMLVTCCWCCCCRPVAAVPPISIAGG